MQYPLISEYVRAMQDPAGNLDQLSHLVSVQDDHGEPMRSSGAFAVVFKMKDESTGKEYALKCFTEEQEGRADTGKNTFSWKLPWLAAMPMAAITLLLRQSLRSLATA